MKTDLFIYLVEIADTESSSSLEIRMLLCNELMTPDALSYCSNHIVASTRGPLQLYGSGNMPLLNQSNQHNEHRFPSHCQWIGMYPCHSANDPPWRIQCKRWHFRRYLSLSKPLSEKNTPTTDRYL